MSDHTDQFHILPIPPNSGEGPRVGFLVTNLRTHEDRHIVVVRDAMGYYEMTANGEFFDPQIEPPYLTASLMAETDAVLRVNNKADASIAAMAMLAGTKKRIH